MANEIINENVEINGQIWKIRQAISMNAAINAITSARISGSVGAKLSRDDTYIGGTKYIEADVVRLNSDGTERQPYTQAY